MTMNQISTKTRLAPGITTSKSGSKICVQTENADGVGSCSSRIQECTASTRQRRKSQEKIGCARMSALNPSTGEKPNEAENGKPGRVLCMNNTNNSDMPLEFTSVTHRRQSSRVVSKELRKSHPCATRKNAYKDKRSAGHNLKSAHSCPTLTDLNNLKIDCGNSSKSLITDVSTKHACSVDQVTKPVQALSRHLGRLHRNSQSLSKYTITGTLPCSREQQFVMTKPPKPPSWQNFIKENNQSKPGDSTNPDVKTSESNTVTMKNSLKRCEYCKEPNPCCHSNEHRRAAAKLRRTRSILSIDEGELPDAELVISLSETEPMEFNLRETVHDDRIYLRENRVRCRKWLETVEESDYAMVPNEMVTITDRVSHFRDSLSLETDLISDETGSNSSSDSDSDNNE
ncbi:uncharacterized protein LOC144350260 [Saccoglossus kowalevskii]